MSHHTALKNEQVILENNCFFSLEWWSRYTEQTVKCEHDYAIYTLQPDRKKLRRKKKKKEKKKGKARKSRRKWNSDIRLTAAWSACGSGCGPGLKGGLLWLVRTNKAVWEHRRCCRVTTISSHHCQVLLPRHPHPHSNQCAHTALKWQRIATIVTLHSIAY